MTRTALRRGRLAIVMAVALVLSVGACNATTAGKEAFFGVSASGAVSAGSVTAFTTYAGWAVQLTTARAVLGPVYLYEGAPQASLWRQFFFPTAVACPTHAQYDKGLVLGEVLTQTPVDLLSGSTALADVAGLAGTCRTLELHLHPAGTVPSSSGDLSAFQGHSVLLEGVATKGETRVPFRARFTIPDEGTMRIVESLGANIELGAGTGSVELQVLLDGWLSTVDFSSLTEKDSDTFLFTEGSQAWTALLRAVRARSSYLVVWRSS